MDKSKNQKSSGVRSLLAGFSSGFATRGRVTLLLFIGVLFAGLISYTQGLTREGFPAVEIPIGIIEADYKVNDENRVLEEVTRPIEIALADLKEIEQVFTYTTGDGVRVNAFFDADITNEEGIKLIQDELGRVNLPNAVNLEYETLRASAIANKYDLLLSVNANDEITMSEQLETARIIASEIEKSDEVLFAEIRELFESKRDLETNEVITEQVTFQRVGNRNGGNEFKFKQAVAIGVVKTSDEVGTLDVSNAVNESIDNLDEEIKDNYTFTFGSGDFANELERNISSLESNAISGILAVVVVSFLFVGWRSSIVTALFIPTVLAATFTVMSLMGMTLNIISLFALILVLGLLVDDAIVVVEAIDRKRKEGLGKVEAIKSAIYEIGPADVSGTITTLLVFAPFLFISGIYGDFIVPIPTTVIIALILSLIIALSMIPFLSVLVLSGSKEDKNKDLISSKISRISYFPSNLVAKAGDKISATVNYYLKSKIRTLGVVIVTTVLIGVGMFAMGSLDSAQFPPPKDGDTINISIDFPRGTTVEEAEQITQEVEQIILETVDGDLLDSAVYLETGDNMVFLSVLLVSYTDRDITYLEISENLQRNFNEYDRAIVQAAASAPDGSGSGYDFIAQVYADESETIERGYDALISYIETYDFDEDIVIENVDRSDSSTLARNDGRRYGEISIAFEFDEENVDIAPIVDQLESDIQNDFDEERLASAGLSSGAIEFDQGFNDDAEEAFAAMTNALMVALLLMFVILVLQFNSYIQTILVMFAIPLSFPLLFPGLLATDNSFSFFVQLGLAGLSGIVVNNTIMLIDFANQERKNGASRRESIVNALNSRFRAIMTTSTTTVLGLVPLALSDPFWEGLALTIIFGIISSSILVVLAFPALYYFSEGIKEWFYRLPKKLLNKV